MEPLHNWIEYKIAKNIVANLFEQYQHGLLSENDKKEMNELALRINYFEKENKISHYGKSNY